MHTLWCSIDINKLAAAVPPDAEISDRRLWSYGGKPASRFQHEHSLHLFMSLSLFILLPKSAIFFSLCQGLFFFSPPSPCFSASTCPRSGDVLGTLACATYLMPFLTGNSTMRLRGHLYFSGEETNGQRQLAGLSDCVIPNFHIGSHFTG